MKTIDIIDPGWDWSLFGIFLILPGVTLLVALVTLAIAHLQTTRQGARSMTRLGVVLLYWAAGSAGILVGVASVVCHLSYTDERDNAWHAALAQEDITVTSILRDEATTDIGFIGVDRGNAVTYGILIDHGNDKWSLFSPEAGSD